LLRAYWEIAEGLIFGNRGSRRVPASAAKDAGGKKRGRHDPGKTLDKETREGRAAMTLWSREVE